MAAGHLGTVWVSTFPAGRAKLRFNERGQQRNLEITLGKCGKGVTLEP